MTNIKTNFFTKTISLFTLLSLWSGLFASLPVRAEKLENNQTQTNQIEKTFGKTPLLFEENKGQTASEVKYFARANGYQLFLTQTETVFSFKNADEIKLSFVGGNKNAELKGENKAVTISNYFSGQDKSKWLTAIPNFAEVWQKEIYRGIDAKFYGVENKQLEYDFIVSPNADTNRIKLNFSGAKNISIDDQGNLVLKTENAELVQNKPIAYQIIEGKKCEVEVSYKLSEKQISFELGEYDKSQTLTIDPALSYLSYIGGNEDEGVDDVEVDSQGNAYITGGTTSLDFHNKIRASGDGEGIFVGKLDANGQNFLYLTILESSGEDGNFGTSIALDAQGNAYVTGETVGRDYPTTAGSFQPNKTFCNGIACLYNTEVILTKLDTSGNIFYSTYLGGSKGEFGNDIAVDSQNRAYIVGNTESGLSFPKKNEFQGTGVFGNFKDAFLTVFTSDGSDIVYSTGLGGNSEEEGNGIAIDSAGNAYITGFTKSNGNFAVKNAFQSVNNGGEDAFVAKFNPSLSGNASLIYSTFLGGTGTDRGQAIAVNSIGQAVITGVTGSSSFPLQNAFRSTNQINEAFVTVLSSNGASLLNSSFLGGSGEEQGFDVKLGVNGLIYVVGTTNSNNFPMAMPFQSTRRGLKDIFITKLRFGSGILSSSYLGGNDDDFDTRFFVKGNSIFVVGETKSTNLSTTTGVIKPNFGGNTDGFIAKILDTKIESIGVFRPSTTFVLTQSTTNIVAQNATFTAGLSGAKGISGDFDGDGIDTIGSFTNGIWKIRNANFPSLNFSNAILTTQFGVAGDLPVIGDWNGDGIDTIGVYRPSTQQFFLSNSFANPQVDITIQFGVAEDLPIAGDWNGDGIDTIAVYRPSVGQTFFTNQNVLNPSLDFTAFLGVAEDLPIAGDWNGDGKDSLGLFRPSLAAFFLSDDNINLRPTVVFGQTGDQPIAGDWDGIAN